MYKRRESHNHVLIMVLITIFTQGCNRTSEVSLQKAGTPLAASVMDTNTVDATAEGATTDNETGTSSLGPGPGPGPGVGVGSGNVDGTVDSGPTTNPSLELKSLMMTTKKNMETLKGLKDFVSRMETIDADKQVMFSFSRTALVNQLKTPHGKASLRKGIDGIDALAYQPDLNYLGKDSFPIFKLQLIGEKVELLTVIDTMVEVTDCTAVKLAIWSDADNDGKTDNMPPLGYIAAYNGTYSAAENYDYFSASNHTKIGPPAIGYESHVFVYNNNEGMYLFFYFNVDAGGSADNIVQWDITTKGNGAQDSVILSDDDLELNLTSQIKGDQAANFYQGRFHYWSNTDGGVIGPFKGTNFEISAKVMQTGDLKRASFFSSDGKTFSLTDNNNALSSFIISFDSTAACQ